ncbi:MAG: histidine--tRNA ligase [Victivallales bacterium]|nr:histidine--tRNA ligase [Victivallales bacterium]
MANNTEPLPGTSDIWEPETLDWIELETAARDVFHRYGYSEIRTPIFERTEVFVRSLGTETDVVQKEMYTFEDRGHRSLTLRPEGTAGVIRAIAAHGLDQGDEARVFYFGPMFRGERPAAGRRRQFHQVGVETVGSNSPWQDVEVISMLSHFLERIGVKGGTVNINTRGLPEDRVAVSEALKQYFAPHAPEMCEDCQRRLETNVWRMLDCKNETCKAIAEKAPKIVDLLGEESRSYFEKVCRGLKEVGIDYQFEPRLVRGLDYYIHTVFEVTHTGLGAQDALAGGGRYRITFPGSKNAIEGIGFAAGMERLLLARESLGIKAQAVPEADIMVLCLGDDAIVPGIKLTQDLRGQFSNHRIKADFSGRSMKAQMRGANKAGARLVIILGENELRDGGALCRNMATTEQTSVPLTQLTDFIKNTSF